VEEKSTGVLLSTESISIEVNRKPIKLAAGARGAQPAGPRRTRHLPRGLHKQAASQGLVADSRPG